MATRQVKDAVDLETNEKIYFKGHAKATYMSDGTTVEEYLESNVTRDYELLTVYVTGISEGFTISVMNEDGTVIDTQSTTYKQYKIKEGISYYVVPSDVSGYIIPGKSELYTAYAYTEREVAMHYIIKTVIRIDQTITDPATMITRVADGGAIEAIRANSHRYTGVFDSDTGVMTLKQLNDNDGTLYADGTAADLTTLGTDVWMKLPQFWYKCEEYATDVWDFTLAYGRQPDSTYKEWDGKDLIGVYEAYNSSSKVYSVSGMSSTGSVSQADFKTYSQARGDGFSIVKWKHHCMMAMLFYAYYGNTNCQAVVGAGTSSYSKTTGATNSLGMTDTVAGDNGNSMSINFWGLENWWGNKGEWIDNVDVSSSVFTVTEDDGTTRTAGTQVEKDGYITKMVFGENIDLTPTAASGSASTGFCDYNYYLGNGFVLRSYYGSASYDGIVYTRSASSTNSYYGSRLAFRGDIVIES